MNKLFPFYFPRTRQGQHPTLMWRRDNAFRISRRIVRHRKWWTHNFSRKLLESRNNTLVTNIHYVLCLSLCTRAFGDQLSTHTVRVKNKYHDTGPLPDRKLDDANFPPIQWIVYEEQRMWSFSLSELLITSLGRARKLSQSHPYRRSFGIQSPRFTFDRWRRLGRKFHWAARFHSRATVNGKKAEKFFSFSPRKKLNRVSCGKEHRKTLSTRRLRTCER